MILIGLFMPLSFMLQVQMQVQMQVQLQVQLQIRMKLTVLRLLLKRILLLIQITVLIMRIMRIIPIYFQGGSISGGSTFKDGSVLYRKSCPGKGCGRGLCAQGRGDFAGVVRDRLVYGCGGQWGPMGWLPAGVCM